MNMIFLAKRRGNVRQFDLKRPGVAVCVTLMLLTVIGSAFLGGFMFAKRTIIIEPNERVARWELGLKRKAGTWESARCCQETLVMLSRFSVELLSRFQRCCVVRFSSYLATE